ncbi:MAG: N-6 DNA methylase [Chloroflexi bacterium]|nr:N-6 DNA methylase [Chloroflexota bacterium]
MAKDATLTKYYTDIEKALKLGNATEHTYRPALKALMDTLFPSVVATNEPKRVKCGAPDYILTRNETPLGYIEAKDVGVSLDQTEKSDQLKRYRESLSNLILTDYLEFRWYINGEKRMVCRLATVGASGKLKLEPNGPEQVKELLTAFINAQVQTVANPKELAERMATIAKLTRETIKRTFEDEDKGGSLHSQLIGFREVLIPDLTPEQFADMYAQTICYGLFAARFSNPSNKAFTRETAAYRLPKTNPFLRKMFGYIAGPELDERVTWVVDDLAELLNRTDAAVILKDFGKHTKQEDPVVHFYETFLAAYDPKMREARGVYYTPEPVVSYIVRSVDHLLKTDFGLPMGLADDTKITLTSKKEADTNQPKTSETHKVQILDPATGTGTFLYAVISHIYENNFANNKGMWDGYVAEHLLPRLFGFELLMAPYTVAHLKVGLLLAETGYNFQSNERLRVYLTNTLEEGFEGGKLPFAEWLVEEANAASGIKYNAPVMVVLGNPPYSGHSSNNSAWIADLLHGKDSQIGKISGGYFMVDNKPLGERNPKWLNDDYVKFIRFAQWRIEQTGYGILAFISNHGYLDNPTFRGMRQSLMKTFDDIYLLDLHGNSKKKERSPDGSPDQNVFDIQQGVAIGIFVKKQSSSLKVDAKVKHAHFYGKREEKYQKLLDGDVSSTDWKPLAPQSPFYLFSPQNIDLQKEYNQGWKITEMLPVNSIGIVTSRDNLTIHWSQEEVWKTVTDFASLPPEDAREKYNLGGDAQDWQVTMAQKDLKASGLSKVKITPISYRPFDIRYTYYTGNSKGFHCRPRSEVMHHMLAGGNLGLIFMRQVALDGNYSHFLVTRLPVDNRAFYSNKGIMNLAPLYLYPDKSKPKLDGTEETSTTPDGRRPNLASTFTKDITERIGLNFIQDGKGDLQTTFGPEDVFNYIYAVFHSPTYRSRYAEFLKIDFPRVPLTSQIELFRALCGLGEKLVGLHLMEQSGPQADTPSYPVKGENIVEFVKYTEPIVGETTGKLQQPGRVWISKQQYFEGVPPEVWEFHIGGYQVCEKWLKDRKGRKLTFDDLKHYLRVVAALAQTSRLMAEVDSIIEEHDGWPLQSATP